MSKLTDVKSRTEILNRLKRAEGQLRGIQRMIEEGDDCIHVARQMAAVRKALDSAYATMAACFMEQELLARFGDSTERRRQVTEVLEGVQILMGKLK